MKKIFFAILVLSLSACSPPPPDPPEGTIPKDSMISLLAEVHVAESRIMLSGEFVNNHQVKSAYMQHVLATFNVDTTRFNQSFSYYTSKPDEFEQMYEDVMEEISKRQAATAK